MFRAIIFPIFRNTRLCVTACGYNAPTMLSAGVRQHRGCIIPQAVTHSLVFLKMDCPKYVELTGIINKPLLLHLVGCLYYLYFIIILDLLNHLNLTLILLTWRIWWAPNNASKWHMGFNSALKVNLKFLSKNWAFQIKSCECCTYSLFVEFYFIRKRILAHTIDYLMFSSSFLKRVYLFP